jgi:hypothetical protein
MSRQRVRPSLYHFMSEKCAYCEATGHILSLDSVANRIERMVRRVSHYTRAREVRLQTSSEVAVFLREERYDRLTALMRATGVKLDLVDDARLHREDFRLISVQTGEDLMRRVSGPGLNGASARPDEAVMHRRSAPAGARTHASYRGRGEGAPRDSRGEGMGREGRGEGMGREGRGEGTGREGRGEGMGGEARGEGSNRDGRGGRRPERRGERRPQRSDGGGERRERRVEVGGERRGPRRDFEPRGRRGGDSSGERRWERPVEGGSERAAAERTFSERPTLERPALESPSLESTGYDHSLERPMPDHTEFDHGAERVVAEHPSYERPAERNLDTPASPLSAPAGVGSGTGDGVASASNAGRRRRRGSRGRGRRGGANRAPMLEDNPRLLPRRIPDPTISGLAAPAPQPHPAEAAADLPRAES